MNIDMESLLFQYGIPFRTTGDIHCTEGWIQLECPYCNDRKFHLGWNIRDQNFNCYACGSHRTFEALPLILGTDKRVVKELVKQFPLNKNKAQRTEQVFADECKWPIGTQDLKKEHKRYLQKRKFCPETLADLYNIKGTHRLSPMGSRVVIPIYHQGTMVSWTARSIYEEEPRYLKCPKRSESHPSSSILYGWEYVFNKVVVVEGIFDAWRLGPGCVATMGLGVSRKQARLLSTVEEVFVLFDKDKPAKRRAKDLAGRLSSLCYVEIIELDSADDPALLSDQEAANIMEELGFEKREESGRRQPRRRRLHQ